MTAEPKRITVGDDIEPILEEATNGPVILEVRGNTYRVNAQKISPSPFTAETVFGSVPPLQRGRNITDEELESIISAAGLEHAQHVIDEMQPDA
jgi:hypothetical protein